MLILVRHPPVALPAGLCYGRLDADIACMSDIAGIIERIPNWRGIGIWSSPSLRCARVAGALAEHLGVESRYDDRLREMDFGAWEGVAWSDVPRAALDEWAADPYGFVPPGGESGAQLIARVHSFFQDVCTSPSTQIIISHGGPLRIFEALIRGIPVDLLAPSPPLGSVQVLQPRP